MISTPRRALAVALGASSALLMVASPAWADGGQSSTPSGQQAQNPSNPPGNNGTVKIDDSADGGTASQAPSGKDNDPRVTCNFTVSFYGFDSSQSADLTFAGQAPTKGSGQYKTSTSWSGKSNRGGQWDATVPVDASTLISQVFGSSPPAKQGYHVKLTVNIGDPNAPQGADVKHKVFWLQPCSSGNGAVVASQTSQQRQGSSTTTNTASKNTGTQVLGTSLASPTTVGAVAKATSVAGTSLTRTSSGTTPTRVLGESLVRAPTGTKVLGTTASRTLPFTGFAGMATAGLGAGLLGLGGALVAINRRRAPRR